MTITRMGMGMGMGSMCPQGSVDTGDGCFDTTTGMEIPVMIGGTTVTAPGGTRPGARRSIIPGVPDLYLLGGIGALFLVTMASKR